MINSVTKITKYGGIWVMSFISCDFVCCVSGKWKREIVTVVPMVAVVWVRCCSKLKNLKRNNLTITLANTWDNTNKSLRNT